MSTTATRPVINSLTAPKVMAEAKANLMAVMKARQEEDDQPFAVEVDPPPPPEPPTPPAPSETRTEEPPPPEPPAPEPVDDGEPPTFEDFKKLHAEHEALKVRFNSLDKRFRALQSSVTKPQQENARLRKQVEELRARLGEDASPESGSAHEAPRSLDPELLNRIKEIAPEAEEALREQDRRLNRVEAQAAENQTRQEENLASYVQGLIYAAHPDVRQIYNTPEFRAWAGPETQDLLDYPWNYNEGSGAVIGLLSAYKAELGQTPPPPPPPPPAPSAAAPKPPPAVPQPARTGVPLQTQTLPSTRSVEKKVLGRAELEALQRELRSATPKRAAEIAGILQEQMRLSFSLRR